MCFISKLAKYKIDLNTWFDVAALCYDYLCSKVSNQSSFLGIYVRYVEESTANNPNETLLVSFESIVNTIIQQNSTDIDTGTENIITEYQCFKQQLVAYEDSALNEASLVYFIIAAIDRYAATKRCTLAGGMPLNRNYIADSYVYFTAPQSMILDAENELDFRDVISSQVLNNAFDNLLFFEKDKSPSGFPPKICNVNWRDDKQIPDFIKENTSALKIAVIPFGNQDLHTDFYRFAGQAFRVKYSSEYESYAQSRALSLLDAAISQGANIIVFPEYVCSEITQQSIQKYLIHEYRKKSERLKNVVLVIAGSGWTEDDNNVMQIFNHKGVLLGKYYKMTPYISEKYVEALSNPGKECTIIDVERVGRILPSICRDVSEEENTLHLAKIFRPFLVLTSAWSSSVAHGFESQYNHITKSLHASAILCNCCEAIKRNKSVVGVVSFPYKNITTMSSRLVELKRTSECSKSCKDNQCMFLFDMDFSIDKVEQKKIISVDNNVAISFL